MIKKLIIPVFTLFVLQSCTVVRPGEVGVKQRMGKLSNEITTQGPALFNLLLVKLLRLHSNDLEQNLSLPSKEGLRKMLKYLFCTVLNEKSR
jgi:hypothetical protein